MVFLFASTTILYFLTLMLIVSSVVLYIYANEWYIFLICLVAIIVSIFLTVIIRKMAAKKYNKSLSKLDYDIHKFLEEQYKFFNKVLINKYTRMLVEMNIACGFINNEQYDKALEIFSKFEMTGYQGFMPAMRIIIFMNQAYCYIALDNAERARPYIQNSEMLIRTVKLNDNLRYEFSLVFEHLVAIFNYKMNPNMESVQTLIEKISVRLNFSEENKKPNTIVLHYDLGVAYMMIGDTTRAEGEFDYVLRTGSNLPCVSRIKAYNETGDINILKL